MRQLHLFQGYGLEMEYMIVDGTTLEVLPIADRVLSAQNGSAEVVDEVEVGLLRWSNELVLHVIELKTNGPASDLRGLGSEFTRQVGWVNERLAGLGGRLLPGAAHPWMDPHSQTLLWPHGNREIYQAYDRIFDCRGHGWSNLQSLHLNLPFHGDAEFGALHAAIRLLLPILPALAASSPVIDGRVTGTLDTRLAIYRNNQKRIPSIAGRVVPEPVFTRRAYQEQVLAPMYRDIRELDPEGILQEEWLNSRGAIARFERDTIEIRVIDVQETALADVAIACAVVAVLQALVGERLSPGERQRGYATEDLVAILEQCIQAGERAVISDWAYLELFGLPPSAVTAQELWQALMSATWDPEACDPAVGEALRLLLRQGPLARRILRALPREPGREALREVYRELCSCLSEGRLFLA